MSFGSRIGGTRINRFLTLAPIGAALMFPAAAQAIDPGVTFDPGSPAGKEYALPIVAGRADGAGTENHRAAANTPFGVGIEPPGGGHGRNGGGGGSGGGSGGSGSGGTGGHDRGSATSPPGPTGGTGGGDRTTLRNRIAQAEEPGGTELWTVGIAAAVLLTAALLAFALRRRGEQPLG
jgi:hypothetical protein